MGRLLLVALSVAIALPCLAADEYRYVEAEGPVDSVGSGLREEGFTSWMRHPSHGGVMVLLASGWLEYDVKDLGEGPYRVYVRGLAWASGCEVDVYWDGEKVGRPVYPNPGTALMWSGVVGEVQGPGDHRLRIQADPGITQAPYIDTILLTTRRDYVPDDGDRDFVSYETGLPPLELANDPAPITLSPEPEGIVSPDSGLEVVSVEADALGLGDNTLAVELRNLAAAPQTVLVSAQLGEGDGGQTEATIEPGGTHVLPVVFQAERAGQFPLTLAVSVAGRVLISGHYAVQVPQPVAVSLDEYAYALDTQAATWTATFTAKPEVATQLVAEVTVTNRDGSEVLARHELAGTPESVEQSLDISTLAPGRYAVVSTFRLKGKLVSTLRQEFMIFRSQPLDIWEPVVRTEARGDVLYMNGKPFLGRLLYHAAPNAMTRDQGYNLFQCSGGDPDPLDSIQRHLDACQEAEVWGTVALFNNRYFRGENAFELEHIRAAVERFKDHPALWGWDLIDEPEPSIEPEPVAQAARLIRELDPNHIVWVNLCRPDRAIDYLESQDLWSFDYYPFPSLDTFSYMSWIDISDRELRGKRPIGSVMQTYAWAGSRMPTPDELRSATYLHIIHDYKWLGFYSYYDPKPAGCMARDPLLWSFTRALNAELLALSPVILGPEPWVPVECDLEADVVQAAAKTHEGNRYVCVVNGTREAVQVELKVEGAIARALFGDERELAIEAGALRDTLEALEARVYEVQ